MTTSPIAATDDRLRPAFVATLVAITFIVGIAAGFALSQVITAHPTAAVTATVLPQAGGDMSGAAYLAQHQTVIAAPAKAGADMSGAAYAAQHPAAIPLPTSGTDMSAAADEARHPLAPTDMSAAAYAAMRAR